MPPRRRKAEESAAFWAEVSKANEASAAKAAKEKAERNANQEQELREDRAAQVKAQMEEPRLDPVRRELLLPVRRPVRIHLQLLTVPRRARNNTGGCPDGLYVEATVDAGGASVGRANSITASLPQGKDAIAKLTDISGFGEKFALTELHCLGE